MHRLGGSFNYPPTSTIDPVAPAPPGSPLPGVLLEPVAGEPQQRRFRTHWNSDWIVFQIVFGAAAVAGGIYRWPLGLLFGALFVYATWIRAHRTVVDRSHPAFQVRLALRTGPLDAGQPIETLRVVRRVKKSKGTTTVTYEILSGEQTVADGLPAKDAAALANELCDFLGRPRVDVPE